MIRCEREKDYNHLTMSSVIRNKRVARAVVAFTLAITASLTSAIFSPHPHYSQARHPEQLQNCVESYEEICKPIPEDQGKDCQIFRCYVCGDTVVQKIPIGRVRCEDYYDAGHSIEITREDWSIFYCNVCKMKIPCSGGPPLLSDCDEGGPGEHSIECEDKREEKCEKNLRVKRINRYCTRTCKGRSKTKLEESKIIERQPDPNCRCILVTDVSQIKHGVDVKYCTCTRRTICPKDCNGSRFTYEGQCVNGIAVCPPAECPTVTPPVTTTPRVPCFCGGRFIGYAANESECRSKIIQAGLCIPGQPVFCGEKVIGQCTGECTPNCPPVPPPPGCPTTLPAECKVDGLTIRCDWGGFINVSAGIGCPSVSREPFPKGLVGVPNEFRLVGCDGGRAEITETFSTVNSDPPGPRVCPTKDGDDDPWIIRMRIEVSWFCKPNETQWNMGDNPQNIGFQSSGNFITPYVGDKVPGRPVPNPLVGRPIRDIMIEKEGSLEVKGVRSGAVVRHIYEQASFDKPANGPNEYPASAAPHNAPSYQVNVTTRWGYRAVFSFTRREDESRCLDPSCQNETDIWECYRFCPDGHTCDRSRTDLIADCIHIQRKKESSWIVAKVLAGDFSIQGAQVVEDNTDDGRCDAIPVPVQQVQTLIRPKP